MEWLPIESAPKGIFAETRYDPLYVEPPKILLEFDSGVIVVGKWDFYYDKDGWGYCGLDAWVDANSGELLCEAYGDAIAWMPCPKSSKAN